MSLNLKNPEAHRLARELANITGESLTQAATTAMRERLERLRANPKAGLAERLMAIGRVCVTHLPEPWKSIDHGDYLYDERGLPK